VEKIFMMLVKHILEAARKRLAVLSREASLFDAARILANRDTPLVVVCDSDGIAVGVISSNHVINVLATAGVDAFSLNAGAIMTKPVLSCRVDENLQQIWAVMNSRILPCAPIVDDDGRAQGVLHARDVAIALIDEVNYEEVLLRDYVMGVGYQ
jgi:CBS domain-containing protein